MPLASLQLISRRLSATMPAPVPSSVTLNVTVPDAWLTVSVKACAPLEPILFVAVIVKL
jgi:hypothetical protein